MGVLVAPSSKPGLGRFRNCWDPALRCWGTWHGSSDVRSGVQGWAVAAAGGRSWHRCVCSGATQGSFRKWQVFRAPRNAGHSYGGARAPRAWCKSCAAAGPCPPPRPQPQGGVGTAAPRGMRRGALPGPHRQPLAERVPSPPALAGRSPGAGWARVQCRTGRSRSQPASVS